MSTDSDPPDKQALEERVEQLEATVSRMLPTRRQALQAGGTLGLGALIGAGGANSVTAGSSQAGQVGTAADPVDVEAEDINMAGTGVLNDPSGNAISDFVGVNLVLSGGVLGVDEEGIEDLVGAMAGTNLSYDDVNDVLNASGGSSVPAWSEDGNSPHSFPTGSSSSTYTLASSYDSVLVIFTGNAGDFLDVRVNGDAGSNYNYVSIGGTSTTSATEFAKVVAANRAGQQVHLSGRWTGPLGIHANQLHGGPGALLGGNNGVVTSPLDSITFLTNSGSNFAGGQINVYGLNP